MSKVIRVDQQVYDLISNNRRGFEPKSRTLRRLLAIDVDLAAGTRCDFGGCRQPATMTVVSPRGEIRPACQSCAHGLAANLGYREATR